MKTLDFKKLTSTIEKFKKDHVELNFTHIADMYKLSCKGSNTCMSAIFCVASDLVEFTHYTPINKVDGTYYDEIVHKRGTYKLTDLQKRKVQGLFKSEHKCTLNIVMRRNTENDTPEIFYYDDHNTPVNFTLSEGHNYAFYNYMITNCKLVNYSNPLADEVLLLQRFKNIYSSFNVRLVKKLSRN